MAIKRAIQAAERGLSLQIINFTFKITIITLQVGAKAVV